MEDYYACKCSKRRGVSGIIVDLKKKHSFEQDQTPDIQVTQGNPGACSLTPTCRVLCQGLAGDASGWLLEGVGGGGGGRAGAGVVTCHVG